MVGKALGGRDSRWREDAEGEIDLALLEVLAKYDIETNKTSVVATLRLKLLARLRSKYQTGFLRLKTEMTPDEDEIESEGFTPDFERVGNPLEILRHHVQEGLISETQRQALILEAQDFTCQEIGDELSMTKEAVKKCLQRAHQALEKHASRKPRAKKTEP